MKIQVYAILKDYFDKDFTVDETESNIEALDNIYYPSANRSEAYAANRFIIDKNKKISFYLN